MKRYLFIVSRSPYGSSVVLEQLETAMVAAAFDGDVAILLRDDGVWSLQQRQFGEAIEQKTLAKVLSGLPSYEIDRLYACAPRYRRVVSTLIKALDSKPLIMLDNKP